MKKVFNSKQEIADLREMAYNLQPELLVAAIEYKMRAHLPTLRIKMTAKMPQVKTVDDLPTLNEYIKQHHLIEHILHVEIGPYEMEEDADFWKAILGHSAVVHLPDGTKIELDKNTGRFEPVKEELDHKWFEPKDYIASLEDGNSPSLKDIIESLWDIEPIDEGWKAPYSVEWPRIVKDVLMAYFEE